ncbi:hypothetical protein [Tessaracoccus sp. G1721]
MHTVQVSVVGDPLDTRTLAIALRRAHLHAVPITPEAALRSPGSTLGASLTLLVGPPGAHPTLESEIYEAGQGVLHVAWDSESAQVGPFVAPGHGPCPACLGHGHLPGPQTRGAHRALVGWAGSLAALQAHAIVRGSTDLVAVGWTWRLSAPGLGVVGWGKRAACRAPGCVQP